MVRNRVFVLSILALLALVIPSAVLPVSAAPKNAIPYQVTAELTAWTISGNAGVAGAVLTYDDGGTKTVTAGSGGSYSILVPDGWVGTVTPSLSGYTFSPTSITYSSPGVLVDTTGQNYTATALTSTPTATRTATSSVPTRTRTPTVGASSTKSPTPTTPSGFTKIYPWNGATHIGLTSVTFTWRAYSPAPPKYRYCVDTSNNSNCDASGGYTSVTGTSVTLSNLAANKTYYWHVQAITCLSCTPKTVVDTNSGTWWSFTTGAASTATPTRAAATRTPTKTAVPSSLTVLSTGTYDGWIQESSENSGVGGTINSTSTTFAAGDDASNNQFRSILSFNTAGLPDNATVKSAVLKIKQSGAAIGTNPFSILGVLRVDIRTGSFGSAPDLATEDFSATVSGGKIAIFGTTPVSGWYSATFGTAGMSKISLTGLTQLRVYFETDDNNNGVADFAKFVSGDSSSGQPLLVITYSVP